MDTIIPAMTVEEAQRHKKCRICSATVEVLPDTRLDWPTAFDSILEPMHIILHYGKEFAHQHCYQAWRESGGVEIDISDKMELINTVGDIRRLIEDMPDSLPVHLNIKGRFLCPVFAIEGRTEIIRRYGTQALEIRDG
jgi:hypothetical protein